MQKRPLMLDDNYIIRNISDAQLAPDGSRVAFVVADSFKTRSKPRHSEIWLAETDSSGSAHPFTSCERADFAPCWSPDGRTLAFISDRNEERQQLYTIRSDGGEARALTALHGTFSAPTWSPDGSMIAFLFTPGEAEEVKKRKEAGDDAIVSDEDQRFKSLYIVDIEQRQARRVTPDGLQVWEYGWSPDGSAFALIASRDTEPSAWYHAELMRIGVTGSEPRLLYTPWPRQIAEPVWSPDSHAIAFISCSWSDQGSVGGEIFCIPASGGDAVALTPGYYGSITSFTWRQPERILFVANTQGEATIGSLEPVSRTISSLRREMAVFGERSQQRISLSRDGNMLAAIRQDPSHPAEIYAGPPDGEWRQLSFINQALSDMIVLPRMESITWSSSDGQSIQGFLVYPLDYQPGRCYPLLINVHGGPASAHLPRFYAGYFDLGHYLAAQGVMTLLPNPRGSFGWGCRFSEANIGDLGGTDLRDILSGADHLINAGLADPQRQAITGWSYGGQMVAWALTQTDRFRAAIMGAAITNLESYYGQNNIYAWQEIFMGCCTPYSEPELHRSRSAIHHIGPVRTPTLILQGAEDRVVPAAQAQEYYRALRNLGVETRLVIYPREGHGISEQQHQRDLFGRAIDWLQRYFLAEPANDSNQTANSES